MDHRDFLQFLLGVFCGQTAALPRSETIRHQLFVSLLTTLLPRAGITDQTVSEVMVLHRQVGKRELGETFGLTRAERSAETGNRFRFAGHCLGFLIGRAIKAGDFGVTLPLSEVTFPGYETRPYPDVQFTRAVRRLVKEGFVVVAAQGLLSSQMTVIQFTSTFQEVLQAVLVTSRQAPTCAVSLQQHSRA